MIRRMHTTRRDFLKAAALAGAGLAFPTIVPSSVFGQNAPSNRLNLGMIGMGLMMVKLLVELHQGKVEVFSEPGSGSTFTVILPWRER